MKNQADISVPSWLSPDCLRLLFLLPALSPPRIRGANLTHKIRNPENGAKFLLHLFMFKLKTMSVPNIEENVPSDVGYLCLSTFQAGVKPGEEEQKFELFLFFLCCL